MARGHKTGDPLFAGPQTIDKPSEGYGEVCNLPIFNQIWRRVRQSCIFRKQTPAFAEKNDDLPVRKFVSRGGNPFGISGLPTGQTADGSNWKFETRHLRREFPQFPFSLKNRVFQRLEPGGSARLLRSGEISLCPARNCRTGSVRTARRIRSASPCGTRNTRASWRDS